MLTNEQYNKIVLTFVIKNYPNFASNIIENKLLVDELITELMLADMKWNNTGNIYGYRKQRLKWKLNKIYFNRKKDHVSLDDVELSCNETQHINVTQQEIQENVRQVMDEVLTEEEHDIISMYYFNPGYKKYTEIASQFNMKSGKLYNILKTAYKKMRPRLNFLVENGV